MKFHGELGPSLIMRGFDDFILICFYQRQYGANNEITSIKSVLVKLAIRCSVVGCMIDAEHTKCNV
jgi:hypothetical protein